MKKELTRVALLGAALFLSACGAAKIGRINADPSRYANRTVNVTGRVVTSVGVLGTGAYQIEDDTGRIYVLSSSGIPSSGSRVTVTGSVISGAAVLGRQFGTAIREQRHKLR
jgi:hypothetical protein